MEPSGPHILVVEDDAATRDMVRELLELEGYAVDSTAHGTSALARVLSRRVDLMLLDRKLPDIDGVDVCRQVRGADDGSRPAIILLTAAPAEVRADTDNAAGADDYLAKPFDIFELLGRVRAHLSGRRSRLGLAPA